MRLVFKEGDSHKFWEIKVTGKSHTVRYGKVGNVGQTKTKTFASPGEAKTAAEALVRAKQRKGYQEDGKPSTKKKTTAKKTAAKKTAAKKTAAKKTAAKKTSAKKTPAKKKAGKRGTRRTVGKLVPVALVQEFAKWFDDQPADSLGIEGLSFSAIPRSWNPDLVPKLAKAGYVLFTLGDGAMVTPMQLGDATPVLFLDSDTGSPELLAPSIENFLVRWSKAKTGKWEIDGLKSEGHVGITPAGRKAFSAWLRTQGVKASRAKFDLDAFLHGDSAQPQVRPAKTPPSKRVKGLPKRLDSLVDLIGRRVDDEVVQAYAKKVLKQSIPMTTTFRDSFAHAECSGLGLELGLTHMPGHKRLYPEVELRATRHDATYLPYLYRVWLRPKWPEKLPFGITWDATVEALTKKLGPPSSKRDPHWVKQLDPSRKIELRITPHPKGLRVTIGIR